MAFYNPCLLFIFRDSVSRRKPGFGGISFITATRVQHGIKNKKQN